MLAGGAGEVVGGIMDGTGVLTAPGLALNAGGVLAIGGGFTIAAAGAGAIGWGATNMNMSSRSGSSGSSSGGSEPTPPEESTSPKVRDVLKGRRAGIQRNPNLPKGSPSYNDIQDMTMDEIRQGAQANKPGYKQWWKVLNSGRAKFKK